MNDQAQPNHIDFTVDQDNLYREEPFTDLKVASIRRLIPITPDGADDSSRQPIFLGQTQLMSPEGPVPLQARLAANTIGEAIAEFPRAMEGALAEVVKNLRELQKQEATQKDDSRIIVPGR